MGINRVKAYHYLEFLQAVFFLHLVPKYTENIDRAVAGGKKIYFSDNGLLNIIGKTSEGQRFENAVANQLIHYGKLNYFNKRGKTEIDFILNDQTAIEVKLTGTTVDLLKLEKNSSEINIPTSYIVSKKFIPNERFLSPVFI